MATGRPHTPNMGSHRRNRQRGQGMLEYSLALGLVALVGYGVLTFLGHQTRVTLCKPSSGLERGTGCLSAWGRNTQGQLGDGTTNQASAAEVIDSLGQVKSVATGLAHTVAVKTDGSVWAWGDNTNGQLGTGNNSASTVPVQVSGLPSAALAVTASLNGSTVLLADGTVWDWGYGTDGELGNNTAAASNVPVRVTGLAGITAVSSGSYHTVALDSSGRVWGWGMNTSGQLGDTTLVNRHTAVQANGSGGTGITALCAGHYNTIVLRTDATAWVWGDNTYGQLGNGPVGGHSAVPAAVGSLANVKLVTAGYHYEVAETSDGTLWAWGYNVDGQLGDETTTVRSTPVKVGGLSKVTALACGAYTSYAIAGDGSVWAWGLGDEGEIGNGQNTSTTTPTQVSGVINAVQIAGRDYSAFAI